MKTYGGVELYIHLLFTWVLDGVKCSSQLSGSFIFVKIVPSSLNQFDGLVVPQKTSDHHGEDTTVLSLTRIEARFLLRLDHSLAAIRLTNLTSSFGVPFRNGLFLY
jgi:hypothetical protein